MQKMMMRSSHNQLIVILQVSDSLQGVSKSHQQLYGKLGCLVFFVPSCTFDWLILWFNVLKLVEIESFRETPHLGW